MKTNALRLILLTSFIFLGLFQAHCQENSVSKDLITVKPIQIESAFLIPKGLIQIDTESFCENSSISYNLSAEWGEDSPESSYLYLTFLSNNRLGISNNL